MAGMDIDQKLSLLGGLSPAQFMRRHWHKKPLLVRQAVPGIQPLLTRTQLLALAGEEGVESRLVVRQGREWQLRQGPLPRRALPPITQSGWTVLLQGMDLHDESVHRLMQSFRFVPDARLDDLMISYATDGGGVGPHFDSYDVFLLQVHGQRRWRIGRMAHAELEEGVPLKILKHFEPEEEYVLEPGDMLYLPPRWAHDGVAVGECMTYSIGFRAPRRSELVREVVARMIEAYEEELDEDRDPLYRDPSQPATEMPGEVPAALHEFARRAIDAVLADERALARALGEYLSEPKCHVAFEIAEADDVRAGVRLDRRSRMLYDDAHVFINGASYRATGRDAALMRRLADQRQLEAADVARLSPEACELLQQWADDGWVHPRSAEVDDD